jgi:hypothetical protein
MSSSVLARLSKLEKLIKDLKVDYSEPNKSSRPMKINKPTKIEDCKNKNELNKYFTVTELKEWLKKNKIIVKKVTDKLKEDFVKIVWENISDEYESESDDPSESDLESDEEWEYYYE